MDETEQFNTKQCVNCKEIKPLAFFLRRSGRRSGSGARRGTCRECRKAKKQAAANNTPVLVPSQKTRLTNPQAQTHRTEAIKPVMLSSLPKAVVPVEIAQLRTNRRGMIWMRGRTDKGKRWHQEIELDLAVTLVKEHAAVIVNRHTIRRLYSNKEFRRFILERDGHICYFCGKFGDTIDHKLPRARGGHTTPDNCVCACNDCNQSKADQDIDTFMKNDELSF
ncbi:ribosomal protein L19E [Paenibacillus castaneae]|uniref:HNH endonuclease n=1 Tax=Paenibacillus castaneae TaxID=474957 RepID=UPI000C9D2079|nr:HNH endonuclease signature motif containing protein [Paenibacillus castaneae]NIK77210.1 ribosomal protein L19E [Paenibacillus castaneae]